MLYGFQQEAITMTNHLDKVAYYYDMGLGKTFIGTTKMELIGNHVNLVICQKSKIKDWKEHLERHIDMDVYDLTNKSKVIDFIQSNARRVGVINYDLIWRRYELLDFLKHTIFTLMLDESSMIQNEKTKRCKAVMDLCPDGVILLSGTPVSGKYEKIWSQVRLLGWNISKREFWDRYVVYHNVDMGTGFPIKVVDGYKNVRELKKELWKYGALFMKSEEAYDLPKQTFMTIEVPSSKPYRVFAKTGVLEDPEYIGDSVFKQILYERMLASSSDKYAALEDLINSTSDRLIVFYNFNQELEGLKQVCTKCGRPYSVINGQTKDFKAYENFEDSVTLIQYQAGAMGLNLQLANKLAYFSPPISCDLWMQSKKRIHRLGQDRPCFYYTLMMKGSIEVKIYDALERGEDYTDELFRKEKRT